MSRIGKMPVEVPTGVEVTLSGQDLSVKGGLGKLEWTVPSEIEAKFENNEITFAPRDAERETNAKWGLTRSLAFNMVEGVSKGYEKTLEMKGVGYRAMSKGPNTIELNVGFSHPVNMTAPEGVTVAVNNNTEIVVKGFSKQDVGQFAANIRSVRPPEPYKGKGIRYQGEQIFMKEGKKK